MRLLITGGAGTLGRHVVDHYSYQSENVHIIDNFSTSSKDFFSPPKNVYIQEGDVGNLSDLKEAFRLAQPTHVIHLAASYKDPDNWEGDIRTNTLGSAYVAQLSLTESVKKVIYAQTVLCYGNPDMVPIPVDAPLKPVSSYAISKTAGEQYLINSGVPYASLRLGNVICPGLSIGPIPNFYTKLKAGESCTVTESSRDFLDLADFLSVLDKVMEANAPSGIFNVSTGVGTTMTEIYDFVARYLNSSTSAMSQDAQPDDIGQVVLDPSHTQLTLNWKAGVSLEDSLLSCLKSYDTHGVGPIYSHLRKQESES